MNQTIEKVIALTSILSDLPPIKEPYLQQLNKKFRLELNYNSTHLEGSTLTYGEVALALLYGRGKGDHTLQEYDEVRGHDIAYDRIRELILQGRPLTEMFIRDLNTIILVRPYYKSAASITGEPSTKEIKPGAYKDKPNTVKLSDGSFHSYASPEETPMLMGDLMEEYRKSEEKKDRHPVELAAWWHHEFTKIHPFDDGNGRIARLIMNYILMRNGLPPVIIKSADKENYLDSLQCADQGKLQPFVDYISTQLLWSLDLSIRAAKGESVDEIGDLDKKITGLKNWYGEMATDEIIKKNPDAIARIVEEVVTPFASTWERVLRKFDAFFFSRSVFVSVDGQRLDGIDMAATLKEACSKFLYNTQHPNRMPTQIQLVCQPKGLRKINKDIGFNGGRVTFFFMEHTYEITSLEGQFSESKLYMTPCTKEDLDQMVEEAGTFLYDGIIQMMTPTAAAQAGENSFVTFTKKAD